MGALREWVSRLWGTLGARRHDHELEQELRLHLELAAEEAQRRGHTPKSARRAARIQAGSVTQTMDALRQQRGLPWLEDLGRDVVYGLRLLRRSPGFAGTAVLSLALGVGANTTLFSIVNAVMLRPLPYRDAERLVRIQESNPGIGRPMASVSHPNFLDWRVQARGFETLAATAGTGFTLTSSLGAEVVSGAEVTADFLPLLGVSPVLGRNFLPNEDRPRGDVRVVILSDSFWRQRFASDPSVLGRSVPLDGNSYSVVGVLPASFRWQSADVLVPLAPDPARSRGDHRLSVIGRLRDGVTIEHAQQEMAAIAAALAGQFPPSNAGWTVRLISFHDWLIPNTIRDALVFLLGAVGVVLLIACANIANLLLARGASRQKELSIRVAMGAARWRVIRQLLTESLLLSLLAGGAGIAGGAAALRLLVANGPGGVPRLAETSFDLRVILFALAISVTTAFVFGIVPAIQVSRQSPGATLQDGTRGSSGGGSRQRLRATLTVVEVALSVALLIGAGLLLRSFWRLQQVDPGFDPTPVMTARVALPQTYSGNGLARSLFYDRLLAEIRAVPGVLAAATSSAVPLDGRNTVTEFRVPGGDHHAGEESSADWRLVSPGYFATMGIPLRGREFSPRDPEDAAPTTIISETMAREYWPNQDPIGQTVILSSLGNRARTVIGVAGDVRTAGLETEPRSMVYYSTVGFRGGNGLNLIWRSSGDPASHLDTVRAIVHRFDPTVPVYATRSLDDLLSESVAPRAFNLYLLSVFAGVALLLAAIGLFGITAYLVSQRRREIGVRIALGAGRRDIFRLILGRGIALALTGAVIGLAAAFGLTRLMQSLLFSVSATDPVTFVAVPGILVVVAILACYLPARRAMRVDPVAALRAE